MVCPVSRLLRSLTADFVQPQHWNRFKSKIWHAIGMIGTIRIAPTVRFDSVWLVGGVVGPDAQLLGPQFHDRMLVQNHLLP